jgi:cytochrome c556
MSRLARNLAIVAALVSPLVAWAQAKPEDAIRARQSIMRVIGMNFGPLGRMMSGEAPMNKEVFQANAARLEAVWAMNPAQFFVPGSDKPVAGSKIATFTDARPEIWSQPDKFKAAAERATKSVAALAQAAKSGDEGAMKAAAGEMAKSCKACHDDFRNK